MRAFGLVKGALYRHYKGNLYRILCVARHSETMEYMVVYQDVSDITKIWARPLSMWEEAVEINGKQMPRFELVK